MKYVAPVIPFMVPLFWGLGGYLGGIFSGKSEGVLTGFFWIAIGFMVLGAAIMFATNFQDAIAWKWQLTGFSFGLVYALGALSFVLAINLSGSATKVVALSALYPVVTAMLFYFLRGEALSLKKVVGITLAVVVGWLMV